MAIIKKFYIDGFTLIEILVVLVIIAILTSIVTISVGNARYADFLANANKIATILEILNDDAVYTNSLISCGTEKGKFDCAKYKNGEWHDINIDRITSIIWPKEIIIKQIIVNQVILKSDEKVQFLPIGNLNPMSIWISYNGFSTWIDGDIYGNFKVSN